MATGSSSNGGGGREMKVEAAETPPEKDKERKKTTKVTTACDVCRLKRQKCDGGVPSCSYCRQIGVECSYSRAPRRRGPPPGYLRHVEVRLHVLESFLGLALKSAPPALSFLADAAARFAAQAYTPEQAEWETGRAAWRAQSVAKALEEVSSKFAPYVERPDDESPLKVAGPPAPANAAGGKGSPAGGVGASTPAPAASTIAKAAGKAPAQPQPQPPPPAAESTPDRSPPPAPSFQQPQPPPPAPQHFPPNPFSSTSPLAFPDSTSPSSTTNTAPPAFSLSSGGASSSTSAPPLSFVSLDSLARPTGVLADSFTDAQAAELLDAGAPGPSVDAPGGEGLDIETDTVRYRGTASGIHHQALDVSYTGSFWRGDDVGVDAPLSLTPASAFPQSTERVELPPQHIIDHLLDIHFQHVHPLFPFLSTSRTRSPTAPAPLILALCAYSACLSPSLGLSDLGGLGLPGGSKGVGTLVAAMWYESARAALNLRKPSDLETVQTLLLLALRNQGLGKESQAWLLLGMAVRISQDMGLHLGGRTWTDTTEEDKQMRRRVWGVVCVLDLLLSLQLGRPSAIIDGQYHTELPADSDFATRPPSPSGGGHGAPYPAVRLRLDEGFHATPLFSRAVALCQIISRINFHLYLGNDVNPAKLHQLSAELQHWHDTLPAKYRISIGHRPSLPVLDVNLLYQVAVILLHRPFWKDPSQRSMEVSLEAATTFNVLLNTYRSHASFASSNPHLIYLIFTAGVVHLSGIRQLEGESIASLGGQFNLLKCVEGLRDMSQTWPLAKRCHTILDGLMAADGLRPGNVGLVAGTRRRRDSESPATAPGSKRQNVGGAGAGSPSPSSSASTSFSAPSPLPPGGAPPHFDPAPHQHHVQFAPPPPASLPPPPDPFMTDIFSRTGWYADGDFGLLGVSPGADDDAFLSQLLRLSHPHQQQPHQPPPHHAHPPPHQNHHPHPHPPPPPQPQPQPPQPSQQPAPPQPPQELGPTTPGGSGLDILALASEQGAAEGWRGR